MRGCCIYYYSSEHKGWCGDLGARPGGNLPRQRAGCIVVDAHTRARRVGRGYKSGRAGLGMGMRLTLAVRAAFHGTGDETSVVVVRVVPAVRVVIGRQIRAEVGVLPHPVTILISPPVWKRSGARRSGRGVCVFMAFGALARTVDNRRGRRQRRCTGRKDG